MTDELYIDRMAKDIAAGRRPMPDPGNQMGSRLSMRVVELLLICEKQREEIERLKK